MDQAGAFTSLWEKKNLCMQTFQSQTVISHIPAVTCSGVSIFLFVCLFWKHKRRHIALTWHNFIWVIFCEIIQVEKQLQSFQTSTETEEMSRDYLIHTNIEAGSKHSWMKQMPDCPNPENNQESRLQNTCMQLLWSFTLKIQALEVRCSCLLLPSWQTTKNPGHYSASPDFFLVRHFLNTEIPLGPFDRNNEINSSLFVSRCTVGKTHPGEVACLLFF